MDSTPKTAMVAGAAGGYLLGRTKKGKLALALGLMFLARRLGITPQDLARKGMEQAAEMPEFAKLSEQVREQFMEAARTALTTTVNRRIDGLSDSLRARAEEMSDADGGEEQQTGGEQQESGGEERQESGAEDEDRRSGNGKSPSGKSPSGTSQRQHANGREPSRPAKASRR